MELVRLPFRFAFLLVQEVVRDKGGAGREAEASCCCRGARSPAFCPGGRTVEGLKACPLPAK